MDLVLNRFSGTSATAAQPKQSSTVQTDKDIDLLVRCAFRYPTCEPLIFKSPLGTHLFVLYSIGFFPGAWTFWRIDPTAKQDRVAQQANERQDKGQNGAVCPHDSIDLTG